MSFIPLKMHSELNWAFVSIIKFSHRSISSCPAPLHQQGAPELITPPDEQSQGVHHGVQSLPMQAADVAMHVVAPSGKMGFALDNFTSTKVALWSYGKITCIFDTLYFYILAGYNLSG